jgi:hypothetical protein
MPTTHTHQPITRHRHIGIRRRFTVRLAYFSAAGSGATISMATIIVITAANSTVNVIGRRNVTGTIVTPVITRAKGTSPDQSHLVSTRTVVCRAPHTEHTSRTMSVGTSKSTPSRWVR